PRALDLQDSARLRRAAGLQRQARRVVREQGGGSRPLEGGWRTAADARHLRRRSARYGRGLSRRLPDPTSSRHTRHTRARADGRRAASPGDGGMISAESLRAFIAVHPAAVLAEITAVRGSAPREAGAF